METNSFEKKKGLNVRAMIFLFLPLLILFLYDRIGDILINLLNLFLNITHIEIDLWGTYSAFLDAFLATVLSILCYIFYRKVFPKKKAELSIPIWQGILFAIVIGLGVGGLSGIWLSIVDFLASHSSSLGNQLESFSGMYDDLESGPYIWTFLAIVVIGPLVEEILFRGIIFRSFEEASDVPWFALLFSGLMFGIWHGSFIQGVYTAMMGIILGYFMKKCRSLLFVVLAHAVNNIGGTFPPALDTDFNNILYSNLTYICIIPMFCILFYLHRKGKKEAEKLAVESKITEDTEKLEIASIKTEYPKKLATEDESIKDTTSSRTE